MYSSFLSSRKQKMDAVLNLSYGYVTTYVARALLLLEVPDILAKAGPLSVRGIAKELPGKAPQIDVLFRILRYSSLHNLLDETTVRNASGEEETRYGLTELSKMLVKDNIPSFAPIMLMLSDETFIAPFSQLHRAVLEGGNPFAMVNGADIWGLEAKDPRFNKLFNDGMAAGTSISCLGLLKHYKNFNNINSLVDVGGGNGFLISKIVEAYPHIRGINFDLPHVIATAPKRPGVEHVAGDMLKSVPSADAIIVKEVLHNWDDEACSQILKNCFRALPAHGRLIVCELNLSNQKFLATVVKMDICMLANTEGKERTGKQFRELIIDKAGFSGLKFIDLESPAAVIEAHKN